MKQKLIIISLLIGLTAPLITTSCSNNKHDSTKESTEQDTTDTSSEVTSSESQTLLYLDNSKSMLGYSKDISGYINVLTQLTKYNKNTQVLLCCDKYKPLTGNVVDQLKKLSYGGSSLLHEDLRTMVNKVNDNNIIFFVTDGIMSGTTEDINKEREWTKRHAADLKLSIKEIFQDRNDLAVSVYQFASQFDGTYFCYDNKPIDIKTKRYFYVFVLGKDESVKEFKSKIVGTEYFKPVNQLHIIDKLPLTGGINVKNTQKSVVNSDTVWVFDLKEINNKKDDPKMLVVTVKASPFRNELNENQIENLSEKFRVTAGGREVSTDDISYDSGSGKYTIKLNPSAYGKQFDVEIEVPFSIPGWVALSSCADDMYMKGKNKADNKTFLLQELIGGMVQGKLGENELLYKTTVHVKRTK